ncbi:hypothetical protein D9619_010809 [Psilocybe cf. subviscida]|uniref:Uncharacterized protein n=1 Tax=Psilocybe cf. subviscida TaxID=2480587 RepID=A0A8H5B8Y0_9AGAR|nr:hypothetical protein D9619_010809 [Psilocybe cf. subviscida]
MSSFAEERAASVVFILAVSPAAPSSSTHERKFRSNSKLYPVAPAELKASIFADVICTAKGSFTFMSVVAGVVVEWLLAPTFVTRRDGLGGAQSGAKQKCVRFFPLVSALTLAQLSPCSVTLLFSSAAKSRVLSKGSTVSGVISFIACEMRWVLCALDYPLGRLCATLINELICPRRLSSLNVHASPCTLRRHYPFGVLAADVTLVSYSPPFFRLIPDSLLNDANPRRTLWRTTATGEVCILYDPEFFTDRDHAPTQIPDVLDLRGKLQVSREGATAARRIDARD